MGILADINAISSNSAELASDQADLASLQASVAAKTIEIENDTMASTQADATLSLDLQADGPAFVLQSDGSVKFYEYSNLAPGYTIKVGKPAS